MRHLTQGLLLVGILSLFLLNQGFAQISEGGVPPSLDKKNSTAFSLSAAEKVILPYIDMTKVQAEDAVTDQHKDIAWRFGIAHDVDLGIANAGEWTNLANGDRIWKLHIQSKGALSLNINYDDFYLPEGAKLFVYNADASHVIGAFTAKNNKAAQNFATQPVKGDYSIIEYYEPANVSGQGKIHINQVVHGYRSLFDKAKTFGASGSCNVNVNCPSANNWQDEKRSIVLILTSNNTRWCSGALINNVRQDSTPYVLTAAHCGLANNSIFVFGYESANCSPSVDGVLTKSITGATRRANYTPSDVTLFELSSDPPASYEVYFSGWSNVNTPALSSTGIHHPRGDVMKFSQDYDLAVNSGYYSTGSDHWEVLDWDLGTTEPTSSGSPLFDQNHRIVGQLHGGDAACGNDSQDYYGKFSYSWNTSANPAQQLKVWLDPDNTGTTVIDGMDSKPAAFVQDASFLNINGISQYNCGSSINPVLVIQNKGSQSITQLSYQYGLSNSALTSASWSSSGLSRNAVDTIQLPAMNITNSGLYEYLAIVNSINGVNDQNASNDTIRLQFQINANPVMVNYTIKTDNFGNETTWQIEDLSSNFVIARGGPYPQVVGGQTFNQQVCASDTCFRHTIFDTAGDGFNHPTFGNGYVLIRSMNGDTLLFENNFTSSTKSGVFCPPSSVGINEIARSSDALEVYPNPINSGWLTVQFKNQNQVQEVRLFDLRGSEVGNWLQSANQIELPELNSGVYFLLVTDRKNNVYSKKLIVQ